MNVTKIIESALKQLGVLAAGENAEASELVDAIDVFRGLLSQWATKRLFIHKVEQITLNLNGSAKVSPNDADAPDYKTSISSIVERGLLNGEPVYIVRDTNTTQNDVGVTYSVNGEVWTFFGDGELSFKALTLPYDISVNDELQLPPSYERPLVLALALDLSSMFGVEPTQMLLTNYRSATTLLKESNSTPLHAINDLPAGVRYGCY
ncbi:MAG: hypothetical protein RSE18_01885 [Acinetobacter sp.]